jgi:hypothetical protein
LPAAVHSIFDALTEDLAGVFLVPWFLGLYRRLRDKEGRTERVLVIALIVVNVGLMLGRHVWVASGSDRRYSLGLLALTIFYVPAGLDLIAQWLSRTVEGWKNGMVEWWKDRRMEGGDTPIVQYSNIPAFPYSHIPWRSGPYFYVLMAAGVAVCIIWLFMPPRADRTSYRTMARWLRQNTGADDVIAVPDSRISFYADRPSVVYDRHFDPRQVDYVVRIEDDKMQTPEDWQAGYSIPLDARKRGKFLAAYKIIRAKQ